MVELDHHLGHARVEDAECLLEELLPGFVSLEHDNPQVRHVP